MDISDIPQDGRIQMKLSKKRAIDNRAGNPVWRENRAENP